MDLPELERHCWPRLSPLNAAPSSSTCLPQPSPASIAEIPRNWSASCSKWPVSTVRPSFSLTKSILCADSAVVRTTKPLAESSPKS